MPLSPGTARSSPWIGGLHLGLKMDADAIRKGEFSASVLWRGCLGRPGEQQLPTTTCRLGWPTRERHRGCSRNPASLHGNRVAMCDSRRASYGPFDRHDASVPRDSCAAAFGSFARAASVPTAREAIEAFQTAIKGASEATARSSEPVGSVFEVVLPPTQQEALG